MDRFEPDPRILEALAHLEVRPWSGQVWRHSFGNYPPDRTNTRGARWNPPGVEALYTSVDRSTAMAEADYVLSVQPIPPQATRTMHQLSLNLEAVIDLRDAAALELLGVEASDLTSDDYALCQAIGGAAAFLDLDGMIVASARAPGSNVVILFSGSGRVHDIDVLSSEAV